MRNINEARREIIKPKIKGAWKETLSQKKPAIILAGRAIIPTEVLKAPMAVALSSFLDKSEIKAFWLVSKIA